MEDFQIDSIDVLILEHLTSEARMPYAELARTLRVSNTLIHQRMRKLQEAGIIQGARLVLDPWQLGYQTSAYTQIILTDTAQHREVTDALEKIPEIVECVNIIGRYAVLARVYARNNQHLRDILYERIHTIPGVEGTNTTISFETIFRRSIPIGIAD